MQPERTASQSQLASQEPENVSERLTSGVQSTVVAQKTGLGQEVQGEAQLPVRLDSSEVRIGELVSQLSDPAFELRFAAGQALQRLGSNAAPAVLVIGHLLASEPQKVHDIMLRILEDCVSEAQATIPALQNCLATTNAALRINCARTLWVLDNSQANTVRPVAEACLANPHCGARIEAASLLWNMDKDPKKVVPALAALLCDRDTAFDYRTIQLLGTIGPSAKDAVPALESWLASGRGKEAYAINTAVEVLQSLRGFQ